MSIEETDRESAAVAKNPTGRIALSQIKDAIAFVGFRSAAQAFQVYEADEKKPEDKASAARASNTMKAMTLCILVMRNGYAVIGKSAPADPDNYNEDLGKKFAYEDAIRQLWPLMAFALKDRLAG